MKHFRLETMLSWEGFIGYKNSLDLLKAVRHSILRICFTFENHPQMFSQHYNHIITKSWSWINIKEPFELDYVWRWNVNLADQVCDGSSWVRKCFKRFILPRDKITIFRLEFRHQWTAVVGSCHYLFDLTSEVKISISILKLGALKCFWAARSLITLYLGLEFQALRNQENNK